MKRSVKRVLASLLCLCMMASLTAFAASDTASDTAADLNEGELVFGAGVGTIVFTDTVFATAPSGFSVDAANTVEQDMHVRVFLLDNTEKAAIVSVEIMALPADLITALQDLVAERTGIPKDNIWVHANHISSTPHAPSDDAGNAAYCAAISGATEEALDQAMESLQAATLTVVQGELDINRNRDTWIDGVPAYGYDNLTGFSNKTLTALCFRDREGTLIGVCYSYGVKPWVIATIGMAENKRFCSSDISGLACLMAEEHFGCPTMYVMPATADQVTEISAKATRYNEETQKVEEYVQLTAEEGIAAKNEIGTQLGNAVIELVEKAKKIDPLKDATISCGTTSFQWDNAAGTGQVTIAVSAITVGDQNGIALVGLMPETNAITERQLQDASPYKYTMVATFVNGDQKYMPDSESYPNESNYNTGTFEYTKTGFAIGCAEQFVSVSTDLLSAILDGTHDGAGSNDSGAGAYLGGTVEIGGYTWTKLAEEDGKYLILCDTIVELRAYHDVLEDATWETCTLRKYLNTDFYNQFSQEEKSAICAATVLNEANPLYGLSGGNETNDYVFLLSLDEAEKYLNGTDLIIGKDAEGNAIYWWLRSPGEAGDVPSGISTTGQIDYHGPIAKITGVLGVRPAMWIDAGALASDVIEVKNEFDGIQIDWSDVADATSYEVLRRAADEETAQVIATVTATSYTDSDVLAGYKYYYTVQAIGAGGSISTSMPEAIQRSVYFGSYEQDNDFSNGKEPIEWVVAQIKEGKIFLVSKYCLDSRPYHDACTDVTWETSSIRTWLNTDFMDTAFSAAEQAQICDTELTNGVNFTYKTPGGNDTADKVFLLSLSEVRSAFSTDSERVAYATKYAVAQGAEQITASGSSWYWTRTPGYTQDCAVYVCGEGNTYFSGHIVNQTGSALRPAIWIAADGAVAQETASSTQASPAATAANVADGIRISWTAVDGAVRYGVYRKTGAEEFSLVGSTGDLSFVDQTAVTGTKYFYKVHAYNDAGDYSKSLSKGIVAQPASSTALTAPAITLTNGGDGIIVRWTSEPGAVEYRVYRRTDFFGEYELLKTTSGVSFTDHTAVSGTKYFYKVRAVDGEGNFLSSRAFGLAATFDGTAEQEFSFEINATNMRNGISLNWPVFEGASAYQIARKVVGESAYTALGTISGNSYLDAAVEPGVKYSYQVSAIENNATVAVAAETISRTVFFGSYEQDNVTENGSEAIEWIVLDVQDGKMLLLSRLNLDLHNYNEAYTSVTWENSTLRTWLNSEFLNTAFTSSECAGIRETILKNENNPESQASGGNDTTDKVFILSMSEALQYFEADGDRQADTTVYANARGSYPNSDWGTSWYWCRTPGYTADYSAIISGSGAAFVGGNTVDHGANAVRPAIWVDADAITRESIPFLDVCNDWSYEAISYTYENGLFNGVSSTRFSPAETMTRAMFATVLYRLDGTPAVSGTASFNDTEAGQWYTDAIVWASGNGIMDGIGDNLFGVNDSITREQMAAILYRYATFKSLDTSKSNDLAAYSDAGDTSSWALDAMRWANAAGLITGRTATALAPLDTTTRAEASVILLRFAEKIAE